MAFEYSNHSGRRRGPFLTVAGRLMPGIARVQADVEPFADAWRADNLAALASTSGEQLWVALGDSLTLGVGASAHDRGWVGQLAATLRAGGTPFRVVNLGVSGATTVDVLDRQLPVLETLGADLVTLMIGSNDLMQPGRRRGLPERAELIVRRLPSGAVVTTLPNPARVARLTNEAVARVAAARGLVVAELRDPRTASWRGRLAADHFHPNDAGYAALAEVIGDHLHSSRRAG